jgi:peptidoglycan/LPS O-acetylase OafA/YrhL
VSHGTIAPDTTNGRMLPAADTMAQKDYYPALTGIRALAMYMVYVQHFPPFPPDALGGYALKFVNEFYVAVIMFFVLSGLLITLRYYNRPDRGLRTYFVNRIARVYPMYFLVTTLTFIVGPMAMIHVSAKLEMWKVYLANITFIRGFFQDLVLTGVAPGWSLTPEEVFYFTAPLAFVLIKRSWVHVILIPLAMLLLGFAIVQAVGGWWPHGFMESNSFMLRHTFFGLAASFFSGVAIALLYIRHKDRLRGRHFTIIGSTVVIAYLVSATMLKTEHMAVFQPGWFAIAMTVLSFLGMGLLLLGLMLERTWLSRLLGHKLVVWLGDSSLTFYLIHMGLVPFIAWYVPGALGPCLITTVVALGLNRAIERPADRWIKRWAGGRRVQGGAQ